MKQPLQTPRAVLAALFVACAAAPLAHAADSGTVVSQSRTEFPAGQTADVTVRVRNSGDRCWLAVKTVNVPAGWTVSNGQGWPLPTDYHVVGELSPGEERNSPVFKVTAPAAGGNADLTWELHRGYYLFGVWKWSGWLSTKKIPVSAPPPDKTAPVIGTPTVTQDGLGNMTVEVVITDAGSGVGTAHLWYKDVSDGWDPGRLAAMGYVSGNTWRVENVPNPANPLGEPRARFADNTLMRYHIEAQDKAGNQAKSADRDERIKVKPNAPSQLQVTATGATTITVAWQHDGANLQGFIVQRKPAASGDWVQIASLGAAARSHPDSGLSEYTEYCYRVLAYSPTGRESDSSAPQCARTHDAQSPAVVVTSHSIERSNDGRLTLRIRGQVSDNAGATNCHVAIRYDDLGPEGALNDPADNVWFITQRALWAANPITWPILALFVPSQLEDAIKTGPIQSLSGVAIRPVVPSDDGTFEVSIPNPGIVWNRLPALEYRDSFPPGNRILWTVTAVDPSRNYGWPTQGDFQPGGWRMSTIGPYFGLPRRVLCVDGGRGSLTFNNYRDSVVLQQPSSPEGLMRTLVTLHNQRFIWWKVSSPSWPSRLAYEDAGEMADVVNALPRTINRLGQNDCGYIASKRLSLGLWFEVNDPTLTLGVLSDPGDQIELRADWNELCAFMDAGELFASTIKALAAAGDARLLAATSLGAAIAIQDLTANVEKYTTAWDAAQVLKGAGKKIVSGDYVGGLSDVMAWVTVRALKEERDRFFKELAFQVTKTIEAAGLAGKVPQQFAQQVVGNVWKLASIATEIANVALKVNDIIHYGMSGGDRIVLRDVSCPPVEVKYIGPGLAEIERGGGLPLALGGTLGAEFSFTVKNASGNMLYNTWFAFDLWEADLAVTVNGSSAPINGRKMENTLTPIADPGPDGTGRRGVLDWEFQKNGHWWQQGTTNLMIGVGETIQFRLRSPYSLTQSPGIGAYTAGPHVGMFAVWYNGYPGQESARWASGLVKFPIELVDDTPPPAVANIVARGTEEEVAVIWERVQTVQDGRPINRDLVGYHVYRSRQATGPWDDSARVATIDARTQHSPIYFDRDVQVGQPYFYCVGAVDSGGNVGGLSQVVSASPLGGPRLLVTPTSRRIEVPHDRAGEVLVEITVANVGGGSINWTASVREGTGELRPRFGTTSDNSTFYVAVPARGLKVGENRIVVRVTGTDPRGGPVIDSSQESVIQVVRAAGAFVTISPEFTRHSVTGGEGVGAVNGEFILQNHGANPITWRVHGSAEGLARQPDYSPSEGQIDAKTSQTIRYSVQVPLAPSPALYHLLSVVSGSFENSPVHHAAFIHVSEMPEGPSVALSGNLAFGDVLVGSSKTLDLTVSNIGAASLVVTNITYPAGFSGNWSGVISAGGFQKVPVTFQPTEVRAYGGELEVVSDATSGNNRHPVSGKGVQQLGPEFVFEGGSEREVSEREGGVSLTVARRGALTGEASVRWAVKGETAKGGWDFTYPASGVLRWGDGEGGAKLVRVNLVNDRVAEPNETLLVFLYEPGNGTVGVPGGVRVTVVDDDWVRLVLAAAPAWGGTVSVSPAAGQDGRYAKDTEVTLRAVARAGYRFVYWSSSYDPGWREPRAEFRTRVGADVTLTAHFETIRAGLANASVVLSHRLSEDTDGLKVEIRAAAEPGDTLVLQESHDLRAWIAVRQIEVPADGLAVTRVLVRADSPGGFYRMVREQPAENSNTLGK